ncbi:MAG: signal peptidase I [candidate division Zixibacteria bacterium]
MSKKVSSGTYEYAKSLIIALILAFIIKTSVVEAYKIPSSSMEDTMLIGDFFLANKFIYGAQIPLTNWRLPSFRNPEPGDVVVFRYPVDRKTNYIKRCVATEGQVVEVIDKVLYIDGVRFPDPEFSKFTGSRIIPPGANPRDNFPKVVVRKNHIFCMGDNRDNSSDSRFWGPVNLELIQGQAMLIHWSWTPDEDAPEVTLADLTSIPKSVFYNMLHFFQRVRWSRLGDIVE